MRELEHGASEVDVLLRLVNPFPTGYDHDRVVEVTVENNTVSGSTSVNYELEEAIASLIDREHLDVPEKQQVSFHLGFNHEVSLEFESPLSFPQAYTKREIVGVKVRDGLVLINFAPHPSLPEKLRGKLIGNEESLKGIEGRPFQFYIANYETWVTESDRVDALPVHLDQLFDDPQRYHGRRVRVSGYFTDELEHQTFSQKRGDERELWLGQLSPNLEPATRREEGFITVDGLFLYGPSGHFSMWPGTIEDITRIVSDKPFWMLW